MVSTETFMQPPALIASFATRPYPKTKIPQKNRKTNRPVRPTEQLNRKRTLIGEHVIPDIIRYQVLSYGLNAVVDAPPHPHRLFATRVCLEINTSLPLHRPYRPTDRQTKSEAKSEAKSDTWYKIGKKWKLMKIGKLAIEAGRRFENENRK